VKDRKHYLLCKNPIREVTHDTALASFDFNWFWLDELKAACRALYVKATIEMERITYQTLLSVIVKLLKTARKRNALVQAS